MFLMFQSLKRESEAYTSISSSLSAGVGLPTSSTSNRLSCGDSSGSSFLTVITAILV